MRDIEIHYNPYKMKTTMRIEGIDVCQSSDYSSIKGLWESKLKSLQIGESVAVGCFRVRGKTISHPIIIKSDFKTVEN